MIGVVIGVVVTVALIGYALEPYITARLAGRPMTHEERDLLGWSGLAVALALFLLAVLIIGTRP